MVDNSKFLEAIHIWKKDYLSPYCLNECKTHRCCKTLEITLDKNSRELFKKEDLIEEGNLVYVKPPCPYFNELQGKCEIWDNQSRPEICKLFPLFYINGELFLSPQCELSEDINSETLFALQKICKVFNVELYSLM